jgi:hypothetical protein
MGWVTIPPREDAPSAGAVGHEPVPKWITVRAPLKHGVERFVAEHAAIQSFDDVQREVVSHTGAQVAKRQVEEMSVRAAADFELFYAERRESGELEEHTRDPMVMTFDGKGIVMVPRDLRPATKKAAGKAVRKLATRLTSGEKRNRKRMAEVAAIYTVPSYPRTAEEVVADLNRCADREARQARPKVRNKRVWASVAEPAKAIIEETFREALARDPKHKRQWVALLDGNEDQLALVKAAAKKYGPVFIVVDLMHVLEYLWRGGYPPRALMRQRAGCNWTPAPPRGLRSVPREEQLVG